MDAQDSEAPVLGRKTDRHVTVEAAWAQEGRIQHVRPVCSGYDHHRPTCNLFAIGCVSGILGMASGVAVKAIHLREELVQRLFTLVVAEATTRAGLGQCIQLVEEEDARRALLGTLEEVPHARRAAAHEDLHEVRGRADDEADAGLVRGRTRQQRLAAARWAMEQHAAWAARSQARVTLGPPHEIHDLHDLAPRLVHAGYTVPSDGCSGTARPALLPLIHDTLRRLVRELAEHAVGQVEVHQRHEQHQGPAHAA
mmetsp:Transcript_45854/g.127626  ORF Transcript_45854/g.127626 Transcript_45854/m.127626 type:complete len:254 (+) Transcript_45854:298-1059(+)